MRHLLFQRTVFVLLLIAFCLAAKSQSAKNSKDITLKWIELLNQHDSVGVTALYSSDAAIQSPNWEGTKIGSAEVRTVYSRYFISTPDLHHELNNIIATDTAVIIEYNFSGTLSNPEASTPAYMKGKKYSLAACSVLHIRNGKIFRQESFFDQVAFLRQVGFFDQR